MNNKWDSPDRATSRSPDAVLSHVAAGDDRTPSPDVHHRVQRDRVQECGGVPVPPALERLGVHLALRATLLVPLHALRVLFLALLARLFGLGMVDEDNGVVGRSVRRVAIIGVRGAAEERRRGEGFFGGEAEFGTEGGREFRQFLFVRERTATAEETQREI